MKVRQRSQMLRRDGESTMAEPWLVVIREEEA